ncbi:hypothetical protein PEC301619_22260 [Pectobacterium carotovorum subsp. carotovorum]|nr:hypothetical protein PEC301619_22260 [Pectobacterium carotovorum subsp. carotovorum]GKW36506.1 hypothetical protein PEC301875_05300 [Pectobacterium carotovorum subsp. carotovorum]
MCAELYQTVFYLRHTSSCTRVGFLFYLHLRAALALGSPCFLKLGILYTAERVDVFLYLLKGIAA